MRKHSWHKQVQRNAKYRLVVPLKRSKHPPEYTARGVAIGTFWATLPLVGIQMMLVAVTWTVVSKIFRWDFSLIAGLAWTWTSNIFTMIPLYYLFYVSGQIMLGNFHDISGFDQFAQLVNNINDLDISLWEKVKIWAAALVKDWGLPLFLGSLPWTALATWAAYVLSYKFMVKHQAARAERMRKNAMRRQKAQQRAVHRSRV